MLPGMNPKQAAKMMKQMGIKQEPVPAVRVEVVMADGSRLVFEEPELLKVDMMGQEMYQLTGVPHEESADPTPEISDEDVKTVMDQTGATEEEARSAIEDAGGDLADAIMQLSE